MHYTDVSRGVKAAKDPAVIKMSGRYLLYYSLAPGTEQAHKGWGIGIAESFDLENWERIGEIAPEGELEGNGICAPGAIIIGETVHLFYQTYGNFSQDAICHATSHDGLCFKRDASNPVFRPSGNWNNGRAIDADVVLFQDFLYLYFATRDPQGKIQMLGAARAPKNSGFSKTDWTQCCHQPVLKPELTWEQECIEAPAAYVSDGKVYLFYAGAYNNSPQQIGLAVSEDGIHFKRMSVSPFLPCGKPDEWNSCESGHPYVFEDADKRIYLFFQGNNDKGKSWYISKKEIVFSENQFVVSM